MIFTKPEQLSKFRYWNFDGWVNELGDRLCLDICGGLFMDDPYK